MTEFNVFTAMRAELQARIAELEGKPVAPGSECPHVWQGHTGPNIQSCALCDIERTKP